MRNPNLLAIEDSFMAIQKTDALSLGKGGLLDSAQSMVLFASTNYILSWSGSTTYTSSQMVEYSSTIWRCITGNFNSIPSTTNSNWELVYKNVKDGDVCFVISGITSNITQRINGEWKSYKDVSIKLTLSDGQLSPATAFSFVGNLLKVATFDYSIKRGFSENRKRKGVMTVLNNGTDALNYDHEFVELGDDVNTWITPIISAGTVQFQYTSGSEGEPITLEYILKGWG